MQDARNFLVTSDYPMDFIVWSTTGTFSVGSYEQKTISIPHELPFTPLAFGMYSSDSGDTWQPFASEASGFFTLMESDPTNIDISILTLSSSVDIEYKIWAYNPANMSTKLVIPDVTDNFHMNTDYNYSKFVYAGVWDASIGNESIIYSHNLGYIPQSIMWFENTDGRVYEGFSSVSSDTSKQYTGYVSIDESSMRARFSSLNLGEDYGTLSKIHYRIYADGIGGNYD